MVGSDQKTGVRELNYFDKSDIKSSIARIDEILKCGIFAQENSTNVLFRAAFIEVLIALRDLMYKSERYSSRIDFSDDVQQQHRISDVSDLIKYVRDALCHPDSEDHYIEKNRIQATFNVAFGKCSVLRIGDFEQSSEYPDDVCFFFGSQRIYLKRHITRAFEEVKARLVPLLSAAPD